MIEVDANERIIRCVRKHWFVLLSKIVVLVMIIAIPVAILTLVGLLSMNDVFVFEGNGFFAGGFLLFTWLLIVWMIGWNMWTDYYLDVLLITDKRIFDIDQHGLFRRTSASFRIDNIQNITVEMKGIIQTLLDFGTIRLETAGESVDFVAHYITNPYEVKKFINEMQDQASDRSQAVHMNAPPASEMEPTPK